LERSSRSARDFPIDADIRKMAPKRQSSISLYGISSPQGLKPANLVQTIERSSLILDVLGQSPQEISVRELSTKVKLPKGTTHRLLSSPAYFGFVRQDFSGDQKLGG
jgi:hypothetical protein